MTPVDKTFTLGVYNCVLMQKLYWTNEYFHINLQYVSIAYNEDVVENKFGGSFELFVSLIISKLTFTKRYRDVIISNTTYNNDIIGIQLTYLTNE